MFKIFSFNIQCPVEFTSCLIYLYLFLQFSIMFYLQILYSLFHPTLIVRSYLSIYHYHWTVLHFDLSGKILSFVSVLMPSLALSAQRFLLQRTPYNVRVVINSRLRKHIHMIIFIPHRIY